MYKFTKRWFLVILILWSYCLNDLQAQDTVKTVTKRHKDRNILSRMDFGGSIGAQFGDVTFIELAPVASYRVTEKFHAGLGFTYQYYKVNYSGIPDYSSSAYGGSIFMRYFIWRDLFAHAEYAPLYITNFYDYSIPNPEYRNVWAQDVLIGGGYRQWIGQKAFMSLMLLFNINESPYSPYSNPIIRIGFGVGI
jgi:hypothetical protein